ncbi:hypothetical protein MKZ38_010302 [Zalerion maritima]|uniref:Uncharacterized protein n=1 Tax=Zalerion maritima TaxID=339359 RepID=A0AAD5RSG4_9PEZI|nr:hypothetical protein MKZ38_010302 [Zalerion maritima]
MGSTEDFINEIKSSLEPYTRTREEAAFIRRISALHVESKLPETSFAPPLALVDPPAVLPPGPELRGRQREYLEALAANLKARDNFEAVRHRAATAPRPRNSEAGPPPTQLLSHHLAISKLSRKLSRLQTVQKHLDQLSSLPAASHEFFSQKALADETATPLPTVPKSVISGVGLASAQRDVVRSDLNDLLNDLEKSVLRAKLALKREEEALEDVKATSSIANGSSSVVSAARLQALTATRDELILWMETELSKAGDDMVEEPEDELDGGEEMPPPPTRTPGGRLHKGVAKAQERRKAEVKLREIREKYAQYMESRKELVSMLQKPSPTATPAHSMDRTTDVFANKPDLHPPKNGSHQAHIHATSCSTQPPSNPIPSFPQAHLLTPYLAAMLSLSREQKSMIQQKSHINVHLSHAARDTASAMDHMAEESQLLPHFPIPKQLQKLSALEGLGGVSAARSPGAETLQKVRGWRHAAGDAKISMLENVTEKMEEGELALGSANKGLDEADELLGVEKKPTSGEGEDSARDDTEEDIWLTQNDSGGKKGPGGRPASGFAERRHGKQAPSQVKTTAEKHDVWARLDGNLGGLNSP